MSLKLQNYNNFGFRIILNFELKIFFARFNYSKITSMANFKFLALTIKKEFMTFCNVFYAFDTFIVLFLLEIILYLYLVKGISIPNFKYVSQAVTNKSRFVIFLKFFIHHLTRGSITDIKYTPYCSRNNYYHFALIIYEIG